MNTRGSTTMTHAAHDSVASPARRPMGRAAKIGIGAGAAALLVGALLWVFWTSITWAVWIRGAEKEEYRKKLMEVQDPALIEKIAEAVRDDDLGPSTRVALANILAKKSRFTPLDAMLAEGDLSTRIVVLEAVKGESYFGTQYEKNPKYRVQQTLVEWLGRENDPSRSNAIGILQQRESLRTPEALPALRKVLGSRETGHDAWRVRASAVLLLQLLRDCDSVPAILEMARSEPHGEARLRALQALDGFHNAPGRPCEAVLSEDALRAVVVAALDHPGDDDPNRAVRMGALGILRGHPSWLPAAAERVRAILRTKTAFAGERGSALLALVSADDAETLKELPRWFHDEGKDVRSMAAQIAGAAPPDRTDVMCEACLIGIVRDEVDRPAGLTSALTKLRVQAGSWVKLGLPAKFGTHGATPQHVKAIVESLVTKGHLENVSREAIAEGMFRWLAGDRGLSPEETEAAVAARAEFWRKARAGDAAGAKAVLDGLSGKVGLAALWSYERGWLLSRGS